MASAPKPAVVLTRRAVAPLLGAAALLATTPSVVFARDFASAEAAKEARKAALRKAAEDSAATGVGEAAFAESEYSVGEDHSPNSHTRQDETLRAQVNI